MRPINILLYSFLILLASFACNSRNDTNLQNHILWYQYPGKYWNSQGLHLGNGYFGATFMGGVGEETLYITEASMWTGGPANGDWERAGVNPRAKKKLTGHSTGCCEQRNRTG